MKHVVRCLIFLDSNGAGMAPRLCSGIASDGVFDNVFPHFDSNVSAITAITTQHGIAMRPSLGAPASRASSTSSPAITCVASSPSKSTRAMGRQPPTVSAVPASRGRRHLRLRAVRFRNGIDNVAIELKQALCRFPRAADPDWQSLAIGGPAIQSHPSSMAPSSTHMDAGGGTLRLDFHRPDIAS